MPNLFVIGFDQPQKAEELCLKVQELQGKYVIDLQEMVVAFKDEKGKVKLDYKGSPLTANRPVFPGFCGSLTALIFLNATTGAAGGAGRRRNHPALHEGIGRNADSWGFSAVRSHRRTVAG
jgi:uncharacterized membrane protein